VTSARCRYPGGDDEIRDLTRSVKRDGASTRAVSDHRSADRAVAKSSARCPGGWRISWRNGLTGARLASSLPQRRRARVGCHATRGGAATAHPVGDARQTLPRPGRTGPRASAACDLVHSSRIRSDTTAARSVSTRTSSWRGSRQDRFHSSRCGTTRDKCWSTWLGNAIEAAGPGGRVEVRIVGRCVEVFDNGPGPGEAEEAFDVRPPTGELSQGATSSGVTSDPRSSSLR